MNFQEYVEGFQSMTCVISVEKISEDRYGEIRIVAANHSFTELLENPSNFAIPELRGRKFIPDSFYDLYLPQDPNFEDLWFRAAVHKQLIHTYMRSNSMKCWQKIFVMPVHYQVDNTYYCAYSLQLTEFSDADMASVHSAETALDVLKTCIKLHGTNDFRKTMEEVIKDIRVLCDAAVCTLLLVDYNAGTCSVLATNIREGSILKRVTQFHNFYDIAASWTDTIGDSDYIIIKNDQDMQRISEINHPWYQTLEEAHVNSVVLFPLRYNNEVLGFIWVTNFDTNDTMRIKETLELTTYFISSQIANYLLLKRLKHISYTDLLTGVKNRNAMNNKISNIVSGAEKLPITFGIIFADLNGLKQVNDTLGHGAGDILLRKAAILLQELFGGDEIFRAGGDEFMVIISGCTRSEFDRKVKALKESAGDPENVCFAVGCHYDEDSGDIRAAMRLADEDMYQNKEAFYAAHPELRHR
ncbi:MAG: GGDEF domain-containing protein [Oscillospiraceae bacterium]|nr:GGDEF domain-containing protein [Oscillospiraceae bacterium]